MLMDGLTDSDISHEWKMHVVRSASGLQEEDSDPAWHPQGGQGHRVGETTAVYGIPAHVGDQ